MVVCVILYKSFLLSLEWTFRWLYSVTELDSLRLRAYNEPWGESFTRFIKSCFVCAWSRFGLFGGFLDGCLGNLFLCELSTCVGV